MKALIVGAGAVGQVYGAHLQRGGAAVGVYVKDKYRAEAEGGFDLHPVGKGAIRFVPDAVACDADAVAAQGPWDQVWLCMSSTALRAWSDLRAVVEAAGPDATIICLQPGIEDLDLVTDHAGGPERVVQGLITMISWHAPLPGQSRPPGVAYWLPPGAAPPFAGGGDRAGAVAQALKAGGYRAVARRSIRAKSAFGSATLLPLMAALELAGWSFAGLRGGRWLRVAARAGREGHAIAAARLSARHAGWLSALVFNSPALWLISLLAPLFTPFPLEVYLKEHFTKVGDQTRGHLDTYLRLAGEHDLPCDAIGELRAGLGALDE